MKKQFKSWNKYFEINSITDEYESVDDLDSGLRYDIAEQGNTAPDETLVDYIVSEIKNKPDIVYTYPKYFWDHTELRAALEKYCNFEQQEACIYFDTSADDILDAFNAIDDDELLASLKTLYTYKTGPDFYKKGQFVITEAGLPLYTLNNTTIRGNYENGEYFVEIPWRNVDCNRFTSNDDWNSLDPSYDLDRARAYIRDLIKTYFDGKINDIRAETFVL